MSATKASPAIVRPNQPDVLPDTSQMPFRADEAVLADELSNTADPIKWPRMPEIREFGQTASLITAACYYTADELADTCPAERTQPYRPSADGRLGWARLTRKMLGAKAPPTEVETKKALLYREIDIFAPTKSNKMLQGIGAISPPRQEAANLLPGASLRGSKASPQYAPFLTPKPGEVPRAPRYPAFQRAAEAGKARQLRYEGGASFLITGSWPCPTSDTS